MTQVEQVLGDVRWLLNPSVKDAFIHILSFFWILSLIWGIPWIPATGSSDLGNDFITPQSNISLSFLPDTSERLGLNPSL